MSKFWGGSSDSSDSEESSAFESSQESEVDDFKPNSKYLDSDEDSFEDDAGRVVLSAKQKQTDALNAASEAVRDALDEADYITAGKGL